MDSWTISENVPDGVIASIVAHTSTGHNEHIVCLDYFDTVVTRVVEPEHTKVLACTLLHKALNSRATGPELYACRRDLELEMTRRSADEHGELEFCLDQFAEQFWDMLQQKDEVICRLEKSFFTSLLVDIEVAVERAVQRVCPHMRSLIREISKKNITLILASDFYLPEDAFGKMLEYTGLAGYFSQVYISSVYKKSKGSGALYKEICKQQGCNPENILMVGDNLHADIHMAQQAGMKTLHIKRPKQDKLYEIFRKEREKRRTIDIEHVYNSLSVPQTEFSEMGVSLWLFIHRLFEELSVGRVEDIFFLSKEGEFLKKLFDQYQMILFGRYLIRSHYLIASRKATFVGSLRSLQEEDFGRLLDHYRDLSLREFLLSLNFDENTVIEIEKTMSLDFDDRLTELKARPELQQLVKNDIFVVEYEHLRNSQAINFTNYLESFNCNFRKAGLHIVDVGWKGSIQDNIFYILGGNVSVHGYFVGSYNGTERNEKNSKKGILFDDFPIETPFFKVYNNNRSLFEMMLGASHGSAACYLSREQFEKLSDDSSIQEHAVCGKAEQVVHIMVLDLPEERRLYESVIKRLQDSMDALFVDFAHFYLQSDCQIPDVDWFARHHARMVFKPRPTEITLFEDLYHLENFGIFEYTSFRSATTLSWVDRLKNFKLIIKYPNTLESGIWPPILLRRLGLGRYQRVDGRRRYFKEFGVVFKRKKFLSSGIDK